MKREAKGGKIGLISVGFVPSERKEYRGSIFHGHVPSCTTHQQFIHIGAGTRGMFSRVSDDETRLVALHPALLLVISTGVEVGIEGFPLPSINRNEERVYLRHIFISPTAR